jgi:hypothetical protein
VDYYHVVFTLPAPIADIAYQNKAVVYGLLFDVRPVLQTIAADRRHLGARFQYAGAAHLGLCTHASSARAPASCRAAGSPDAPTVDRLPARLLPVGARAVAVVPLGASSKNFNKRIARSTALLR